MGVKSTAHSTSLLGAQIQGLVLLVLIQLPQLLLLIHDNKDSGNRFPDNMDLRQLGCCSTGNFCHTELGEFFLQLIELLQELLLLLSAQIPATNLGHGGICSQ